MADVMKLQKPANGQILAVAAAEGANIELDFAPADAMMAREGDNLVFTFENGGKVEVADFYAKVSKSALPDFVIQGQTVAGADFFAALGEDLQPAAGPAATAAAQNSRFYDSDNSTLMDGVDSLDGLDISNASGANPDSVTDVLSSGVGDVGATTLGALDGGLGGGTGDGTGGGTGGGAGDGAGPDVPGGGGGTPPPVDPDEGDRPTPPTTPEVPASKVEGESVTVGGKDMAESITVGCEDKISSTVIYTKGFNEAPRPEDYFKDSQGNPMTTDRMLEIGKETGSLVVLTGMSFAEIVEIVNNAGPGTVFHFEGVLSVSAADGRAGLSLNIPKDTTFIMDGIFICESDKGLADSGYKTIYNNGVLIIDETALPEDLQWMRPGSFINGYWGSSGSLLMPSAPGSAYDHIHNPVYEQAMGTHTIQIGGSQTVIPDLQISFDEMLKNDTGIEGITGLIIGGTTVSASGTYTDDNGCTYVVDFEKGTVTVKFDKDFTESDFGYVGKGADGKDHNGSFDMTLGDGKSDNIDDAGNFVGSAQDNGAAGADGADSADSVDGASGASGADGADGNDNVLVNDGDHTVNAGAVGNDQSHADNGGDAMLLGGEGDDVLFGGGNDFLFGGAGSDVLLGGADNAAMEGDAGTDYLVGLDKGLLDSLEDGDSLDSLLGNHGSIAGMEVLVFNGQNQDVAGMPDLLNMGIANEDGSLNMGADGSIAGWSFTGKTVSMTDASGVEQQYQVYENGHDDVQIAVLQAQIATGNG